MPTTGSGVGTPITGGGGSVAIEVARPLRRTHLSLHEWARRMGINPIHFSSATVSDPVIFRRDMSCSKVWTRHTWQTSDQASHEDLAYAIRDAEETIARWLGYNVCPDWYLQEEYRYPKYLNKYFTNTLNQFDQRSSISLRQGKFIAGGRRRADAIAIGATVNYTSEDGDTFLEMANVQASTSVTDYQNIRIFIPGTNADPRWEIRPLTAVSVSGGTVTIKAPSWLFIDPDLQAAFPGTGDWEPIDLADTDNLVATVDIYHVYNDTSQVASRYLWEERPVRFNCSCSGVGCPECAYVIQDGCLLGRDDENGVVVPIPSTYKSGAWSSDTLTVKRSPDKVHVWYYAGNVSDDYDRGWTNDPLEDYFAEAIAYLAIARLDRKVCECNASFIEELQTDMAFVSPEGNFLTIAESVQQGPFGTKRGEWLAYQRVKHTAKRMAVALL